MELRLRSPNRALFRRHIPEYRTISLLIVLPLRRRRVHRIINTLKPHHRPQVTLNSVQRVIRPHRVLQLISDGHQPQR